MSMIPTKHTFVLIIVFPVDKQRVQGFSQPNLNCSKSRQCGLTFSNDQEPKARNAWQDGVGLGLSLKGHRHSHIIKVPCYCNSWKNLADMMQLRGKEGGGGGGTKGPYKPHHASI